MKFVSSAARFGARQTWLLKNRRAFREAGGQARRRLLVDVSVIARHDARTGIQRVVRAVTTELLRRDGAPFAVEPVVATLSHGYRHAPGWSADNRRSSLGDAVQARLGDMFLGLDLSAHLLPLYTRQVEAWRSAGATVHLVVYDLLPLRRPDWFMPSTVRNYRRWFDMVAIHCDQALCISDHVAADLREALGAHTPPIGRLEMTGDLEASLPSRGISPSAARAIAHARGRPTTLMVGTVEPRKGYDAALDAFELLWRRSPDGPSLVIVGKPGWRTRALQSRLAAHPESGKRLHWVRDASDEALAELYEACTGLFMASRGEGFGLPAVEATNHGKPALLRDLAVFREQDLPGASYFSDDRPEPLADAIAAFSEIARTDPPPRRRFESWSSSVDKLLMQLQQFRAEERAACVRPTASLVG